MTSETLPWDVRMRILFVAVDFAVPARTGLQKQTLMLLRYLLKHGQECTLLAFQRPGISVDPQRLKEELPLLKAANLFSWRHSDAVEMLLAFLRVMARPQRLPARPNGQASFQSALIKALREPGVDLVHLEGIALAPYLHLVAGELPTVFSIIDSISLRQQRLAVEAPLLTHKIYRRCAAWVALGLERALLPRATKVQVVSEAERSYLQSMAPGADLQCIGLAVPDRELVPDAAQDGQSYGQHLFFSSALDGYLGRGLLWFLTEVYPKVAARFPDLQMTVIGAGRPAPALSHALKRPGITVISWLNVDDYNAELKKAKVAVAPDPCGTGMKTRVLTAMALARPVVGTPAAFEGLALEKGVGGFCCESADDFATAISSLLADSQLRARIGEAGHQFVLERHALSVIGKQWLDLYDRAIQKFTAAQAESVACSTGV
ncbi:MAG: glycosyltransferase family 4 protein [Candidatus Binataceae bacterium]